MANKAKKLDNKDLRLLEILQDNPQSGSDELAAATGYPASTIRKRLINLKKSKAFQVRAVFPVKGVISIDVDQRAMVVGTSVYSSQEEFALYIENKLLDELRKKSPNSANVRIDQVDVLLGGRSDLIAIVEAPDVRSLGDFVTKGLAIQTGVKATNTAMVSSPTIKERLKFQERTQPRSQKGTKGGKGKLPETTEH
jgi:DNA-binding Lrp family transcriptional regulator